MIRKKMKRQQKMLIISSLSLILCLSVGYAAFNTQINIKVKGNIKGEPLEGPAEDVITKLAETDTDELYTTENNDIRYFGEDPNNYVYFNCTNVNDQTSSTCDLWRIMGVIDGKVKIIRSKSLPPVINDTQNGASVTIGTDDGFYWNYVQQEGKNYNNWEGSTLQNYLNGTYYNSINDIYQNMISPETYYLGGGMDSNYQTFTANSYYNIERDSSQVYSGNPASTTQKIGLMYSSDYGYAAGESCLSTSIFYYSVGCINSDYLFNAEAEWNQNPFVSFNEQASYINAAGNIYCNQRVYLSTFQVRPVLYLTSQTQITGGDGSQSNPFTLS